MKRYSIFQEVFSMTLPRRLTGTPVCQKPQILELFLRSLASVETDKAAVDFFFIDDNQEEESKELLKKFGRARPNVRIEAAPQRNCAYVTNEETHYWNDSLVLRVADMKNRMIAHAVENGYDYLFLIDSDLLVAPCLLTHLMSLDKDVVSEIFWTSWRPGAAPLPNVWLYDKYDMARPSLDPAAYSAEAAAFLSKLGAPGVYKVGGLGACTLISAAALRKGLNFSPISNLSLWGEDRWFCVRAAAAGFRLFADTHYPAEHLYRMDDASKN
jgi:GT2 family glycosyltransferase